MSYTDNIQRARQQSAKERAAHNIHERLEKIMLADAEKAARRWFWELLQNARDVAPGEHGVCARLHLNGSGQDTLVFSHNGGPFNSADLVRLTEQDSSKRAEVKTDRPRPIGRFGTGFLTTHLLARKVYVEGVIHDEGEAPKRFRLPLDRSGDTEEELQRGVDATFKALEQLDTQPPVDHFAPGDFNTFFTYHLDEAGLQTARQGLADLHAFLPLTLALNTRIDRVEIVHDQVTYAVTNRMALNEGIQQVSVSRSSRSEVSEEIFIVVSNEEQTTFIALPIQVDENTTYLLDLSPDTPRLFCDFPLIGTEGFSLPVVVNNPLFHPTEPRNGIWLTDRDHDKPKENKAFMADAVKLYLQFLQFAADRQWRNLLVLANLQEAPKLDWLSQGWIKKAVLQPVREQLFTVPIVETATGELRAMKTDAGKEAVYFPSDPRAEARDTIWEIAATWMAHNIPKREHLHTWYQLLWTEHQNLDVAHLVALISSHRDVASLATTVGRDEAETCCWLSKVVDFLHRFDYKKYLNAHHAKLWQRSRTGSYNAESGIYRNPILPNQHGIFCLKNDLYLDDEIDEDLKDIATSLGKDYRTDLLHRDIALDDPDIKTLASQDVAQEIESRVRDRIKNNNWHDEAFRALLRWFDEHPQHAEDWFSLYGDQHLLQTAEEAREVRLRAARASQLEREVGRLQTHQTALEDEKQQLQVEVERLREQVERLQAKGTASAIDDNADGEAARHHAQQLLEVWEAIKEALGELGTEQSRRAMQDLDTWMRERPELFRHVSEASREAYLNWLVMVVRAKQEVKAHLERQPDERYDITDWQDDERFPTIVTGVKYCGRDITLVIRPADGGFIILYEELEKAILEGPDAELWIQGGGFEPQRFNLGKLTRFLGVNRLPLKVPASRPAVLYLN